MVIDLPLVPETEARLRERAAATGRDVVSLIRDAVEEKFGSQGLSEILAPVHEEFRESGISEQALDELLTSTLAAARRDRRNSRNAS
jgi:hypothetical protein